MGPLPVSWVPSELSYKTLDHICMKSFNILSGEGGTVPKSMAIVPFPSEKLKGLIRTIEIWGIRIVIIILGGTVLITFLFLFFRLQFVQI